MLLARHHSHRQLGGMPQVHHPLTSTRVDSVAAHPCLLFPVPLSYRSLTWTGAVRKRRATLAAGWTAVLTPLPSPPAQLKHSRGPEGWTQHPTWRLRPAAGPGLPPS